MPLWFVCETALVCQSRHTHTQGGLGQPLRLPLAVDGSKSPEGIPDDRAHAHFLIAMATATDPKVLDIVLGQVGLDPNDRAAFAVTLAPLTTDLAVIAGARLAGGTVDRLSQQQRTAIERARGRVRDALTATGRDRIEAYVQTACQAANQDLSWLHAIRQS